MAADPRLSGFAARTAVAAALAALETGLPPPGEEWVAVAEAAGRVLAQAVISPADWPDADRAAADGYAIRAAESEGAGPYSPVALRNPQPVAAGAKLPPGLDAVAPFEAAERTGAMIELTAPVAAGAGVERRAAQLRRGETLMEAGRRLRPAHLALLSRLGVPRVAVRCRPVVSGIAAGAKDGPEALIPMLQGLIRRDGGAARLAAGLSAGAIEAAAQGCDLLLIAGRAGAGGDDGAPGVIAAAGGRLDLHGIALQPGGSAGIGWLGNTRLLLLPGDPADCLAAYDVLAAQVIRGMAGLGGNPYPRLRAVLARKIASALGTTELVQVRLADGQATPLPGGLASAARADGFVVVPEASEGFAPGSTVCVHLHDREADGS